MSENYRKEFFGIVEQHGRRHDRWRIFGDFAECAALALHNRIVQEAGIESRYKEIMARYEPEEQSALCHLLALAAMALHENPEQDFLGDCFMELDLSNQWAGQFFTPHHMSKMMARMQVCDGLKERIESQGFATVNDPACGAGGMLIAFCNEARAAGIDYSNSLYFVAQDIAPVCAHMTMIQLSLLHAPACVVIGDTLRMEYRQAFWTPAYHLHGWNGKLQAWRAGETPQEVTQAETAKPGQMPLFA